MNSPDPVNPPILPHPPGGGEVPSGPQSAQQGPGRMIRLARERARLSLEELAVQTRLAKPTLDALERDDFGMLNEPVYVRGYYRKCAKALSLPEPELLRAYENIAAPKAPSAPTKLPVGRGDSALTGGGSLAAGLRFVLPAVFVGALVAVGIFLYRAYTGAKSTHESASVAHVVAPAPVSAAPPAPAASPPPPPVAVPPAAAPQASAPIATPGETPPPASPPPDEASAGSVASPAPAESAASAPAQSSDNAAPSPAVPAAEGGALSLSFQSNSWVRVADSSGKVLLSGVMHGGERHDLGGSPPFSLFVGNAPGVSVTYGGKTVDLAPYIKSNNTARLTVPVSADNQ